MKVNADFQRLVVLIAVCFVDMIGLLMIAPLITFYALRLGGTPSSVGPLFSAFAVAQLLSFPHGIRDTANALAYSQTDRKSVV